MALKPLKQVMKIQYNAPVILTFSLLAVAVYGINLIVPHFTLRFFVMNPDMSFYNPLDYFRLLSYTLGHANLEHLFGNLMMILLLGPILEEKYGSRAMSLMMLVTAFSSGLISVLIFHTAGLGASGIVFMLILLASVVNVNEGRIPLTFVLVVGIFIGREILQSFRNDNISHAGHILGGSFGAFFGFKFTKLLKPKNSQEFLSEPPTPRI
jgi:membrane associated rhomboid family serine protease